MLTEEEGKEEVKDEAVEKEMTKCGEYELRFLKINEILSETRTVDIPNLDNCSQTGAKTKLRLPKIELKKFDGDLKGWIGFWGQFAKIHDDETLMEQDKFEYLRLAMKPDSPAYKLIEGFPPSKENYRKAIELLKSRYGKEELLIEYYVRELLSLVLQKSDMSVAQLYDKLEAQLRALDSLGVTKEKYAAMLFPLVESAIPENMFKVWERYRVAQNTSTKESDDCLGELLNFLKIEVEGEERLKLRMSSFESCDPKPSSRSVNRNKVSKIVPSAAALVSSVNLNSAKDFGCVFCNKTSHASSDCATAIDSSMEERNVAVRKKGACFRCLKRGHLNSTCKTFIKCPICKGKHYAIMCSKLANMKFEDNEKTHKAEKAGEISMMANSQDRIPVTYLQTMIVDAGNDDVVQRVRVLCDSGSQRSYITKECARELDLIPTGEVMIQQELFGGKKNALASHKRYLICLKNLNSNYLCKVDLLEQDHICNFVPKIKDIHLYEQLKRKGISLTDVTLSDDNNSNEIQVLLGADVWSQIITNEFFQVNKNLVAIKTRLGWSLLGSSRSENTVSSTFLVTLLNTKDVPKLWDLEVLGIMDPGVKIKQEERDKEVATFFKETVKRDSMGRYVVRLPWTDGCPPLENNREAAERRLQQTTRKLNQMNKFQEYDLVFKDWLKQGIIEVVDEIEPASSAFYLPHRAVLKENSTTPVRPVFDASTKDRNGHSLNESLEKGPNLIELVPLILMHFRNQPVGLSADIEKAFLQIELQPADRDVLRFLWWENNRIITFRHCRVVFGVSCSPYLLGAVINHLLENAPSHLKHTAETLRKSFYVDNCLAGVDTKENMNEFINEAQHLMASAGFNLRGWVSSESSGNLVENVLGLQWCCSTDELGCNIQMPNDTDSPLTRRSLLSSAQKIFDPIGFTTPVMLIPKILLQKTWALKVGWDGNLPEDICKDFDKWVAQLGCLTDCKIPRRIIMNESSTLHVFCDASKMAFATCIFLRTEINEEVFLSLIMAKSRVAPTKVLTMPRLELMAAVIGIRLNLLVKQGLDKNLQTYFWSDSTVTLAWIAKQGPWSVFIENRVKEIHKYSHPDQWRHVPGNANPADLLSRGCMPQQLLHSEWWEGPSWLLKIPEEWPSENPVPEAEEVEKEKRKTVITVKVTENEDVLTQLAKRFSSFSKMVRVVAWILRFQSKAKDVLGNTNISGDEYLKAEKVIYRCIQNECFLKDANKTTLKNLHVFSDDEGILRMKSRLLNEEETEEYLCPMILPSKHPIVKRMIEQQHVLHKHASTLTLLTILREKVWILKGRRTVSTVVRSCIICRKQQAKALKVPFPPLPKDRTKISATFQVTGVDLAGPLFTRSKEKCWIVIFTCAVYRAVHLELARSLSTSAFIQALRRFIARRGRVSIIYSDNGTNFVGLNTALNQLDWTKIQTESDLHHIRWKFNPPSAPWWGGFWERLIGVLKSLLRKNLGQASLNYDELSTLLCECESVMNNRPLTYISEDPNELKVLKPSMFLQSLSGNETPDLDQIESISLVNRWKYIQKIRENLRKRFKKEYLGFLRSTKRIRTDTIKVGDIVLVSSDDKKRLDWSLAKVIEVIPGKDNINRLIRVKTSKNTLLRPVQRLFPLEMNCGKPTTDLAREKDASFDFAVNSDSDTENDDEDDENIPVKSPAKTRTGRVVRPVKRLNL